VVQLRVIAVCALILISCSGLGAAALWAITRTREPVTIRETRVLVRALASSALSTWVLLIVAPGQILRSVGVFFVVYATVVMALLAVIHYKIKCSAEERTSDE
jgi:hypothetical protein